MPSINVQTQHSHDLQMSVLEQGAEVSVGGFGLLHLSAYPCGIRAFLHIQVPIHICLF